MKKAVELQHTPRRSYVMLSPKTAVADEISVVALHEGKLYGIHRWEGEKENREGTRRTTVGLAVPI